MITEPNVTTTSSNGVRPARGKTLVWAIAELRGDIRSAGYGSYILPFLYPLPMMRLENIYSK